MDYLAKREEAKEDLRRIIAYGKERGFSRISQNNYTFLRALLFRERQERVRSAKFIRVNLGGWSKALRTVGVEEDKPDLIRDVSFAQFLNRQHGRNHLTMLQYDQLSRALKNEGLRNLAATHQVVEIYGSWQNLLGAADKWFQRLVRKRRMIDLADGALHRNLDQTV